MRQPRFLVRDERGAGIVEFALAAPVLFLIIIGVAQLGILFSANAGLSHAVAEGARLAAIYPRPSDADIVAAVVDSEFSLKNGNIVADPTIVHKTDASGFTYAEISLSYRVPLDFIFFEAPPLTLTETRTVYTQPAA